MGLDLTLDDEQQQLAASVRSFCARQCTDEAVRAAAGTFPKDLWAGLAELGVLALATPEGGGGALHVVAAMEELGGADFPGPLVPAFLGSQILGAEQRAAVGAGELVVSAGTPPLLPWAPAAGVFVELDGDRRAWLCRAAGPVEAVDTLAGEPWGRVDVERLSEVDPASLARGMALADIALAAYLAGAGGRLVELAAGYARDRVQFGKSIGEFQAVAHPLADSAMRVSAAAHLARMAAFHFDQAGPAPSRGRAAAARLSAAGAALSAAYRAHQTFGALGFTVEGPVGHRAQRVRQLSLLPPGAAAARAAVLQPFHREEETWPRPPT